MGTAQSLCRLLAGVLLGVFQLCFSFGFAWILGWYCKLWILAFLRGWYNTHILLILIVGLTSIGTFWVVLVAVCVVFVWLFSLFGFDCAGCDW